MISFRFVIVLREVVRQAHDVPFVHTVLGFRTHFQELVFLERSVWVLLVQPEDILTGYRVDYLPPFL